MTTKKRQITLLAIIHCGDQAAQTYRATIRISTTLTLTVILDIPLVLDSVILVAGMVLMVLEETSVVAGKVLSALGVIRMVLALGVAECGITKKV